MSITQRPSPHGLGRVRLYDGDHWFVECHESRVQESIQHHIDSHNRHFGGIAEARQSDDPNLVIADGKAYSIGRDTDYPRGFGGQAWSITFFDGRAIDTVSLWFLGEIPADWIDRIPNNATLKAGIR